MKGGSWASFQAAAELPDREEEKLESRLSSYSTITEQLVTRAEYDRLWAACRCALAALTQHARHATYSADIALAMLVLHEAIGEDGERS